RGGPAVGGIAVDPVLSGAHRRRGRARRAGAQDGAHLSRPVTETLPDSTPAALGATLARGVVLIALMLPPVRRAIASSGLGWAYLVALAFALALVGVGVLDDLFDVAARFKLAGQIVAVAVAMAYGVVLDTVPAAWPGSQAANVLLTLLWFVTVTNALQFLDGMDGLAAGLGAVAALFFSLAALQTNQPYLMFLAAPLVGACLGFLPYNFRFGRPATIFLGDAGASFIGFTLAGLA